MKKIFFILDLLLSFTCGAQTGIINTIAGNGSIGNGGNGNPATIAELNSPTGIAVDNAGNLYISDCYNNVIRKVNTEGIISIFAGTGVAGYSGDGELATAAELNGPDDFAIDNKGNFYISDNSNSVIRKINTSGVISTIAGNHIAGYGGDGGPATDAELQYPCSVKFDGSGNIYISDAGNSRVRKISTSGIISTIAGNGVYGYNGGDNGPATNAELKYPGDLAIGMNGDVYIPDYYNRLIRKVNSAGIISTIAGNGVAGYSGDGSVATSASLYAPTGVAIDNSGNFFIADAATNVIRKVNASAIISTIAGTDTVGFTGDGGPAINAQFNKPDCLAVNLSGNIYIADVNNQRIRKITYYPEAVNNVINTQNSVSVYPNPASNEVTIKTASKIESIELLNIIGQEVDSPRPFLVETEISLNVSFLANGVYFVKVNGVYAGKFVKD